MSGIQIPESTSTVQVAVIDTTTRFIGMPTSIFWGPELKGFDKWTTCAYAFLVTHTDKTTGKQRRIVFDLGPPKDWENDLPPPLVENTKKMNVELQITKYASEILEENGVPLESIEAVVWSHTHFDHVGRVSLFPSNVNLITGPGVKQAYAPGYPTVQDAPVLERDFAGRDVIELDFTDSQLTLGDFQAIDFFGDGSFYFLSAPGHSMGHINALARTTAAAPGQGSGSTFILMGADSYHHPSMLRPSSHTPLPDEIHAPLPDFSQYKSMCPGHIFDVIHPSHRKRDVPAHYVDELTANHSDPKKTPYFTVSSTPEGNSLAIDIKAARNTIKGLQAFDGDENVLLVAAHDWSLYELFDYFPKTANDWKAKGWKEEGRWRFLNELSESVKIANE